LKDRITICYITFELGTTTDESVTETGEPATSLMPAVQSPSDLPESVVNPSLIDTFLDKAIESKKGSYVLAKEFRESFVAWLPAEHRRDWNSHSVPRALRRRGYELKTGLNNRLVIVDVAWKDSSLRVGRDQKAA
jgi:hypothetical protein